MKTGKWAEWTGASFCPVLCDSEVLLRFRSDDVVFTCTPGLYWWVHSGTLSDIVAYMILEEM